MIVAVNNAMNATMPSAMVPAWATTVAETSFFASTPGTYDSYLERAQPDTNIADMFAATTQRFADSGHALMQLPLARKILATGTALSPALALAKSEVGANTNTSDTGLTIIFTIAAMLGIGALAVRQFGNFNARCDMAEIKAKVPQFQAAADKFLAAGNYTAAATNYLMAASVFTHATGNDLFKRLEDYAEMKALATKCATRAIAIMGHEPDSVWLELANLLKLGSLNADYPKALIQKMRLDNMDVLWFLAKLIKAVDKEEENIGAHQLVSMWHAVTVWGGVPVNEKMELLGDQPSIISGDWLKVHYAAALARTQGAFKEEKREDGPVTLIDFAASGYMPEVGKDQATVDAIKDFLSSYYSVD